MTIDDELEVKDIPARPIFPDFFTPFEGLRHRVIRYLHVQDFSHEGRSDHP